MTERLLRARSGERLVSVDKLNHIWSFRLTGEIAIATESLWRLLHDGRIVVTSEDYLQSFGLSEPVDAGQRLAAAAGGRAVVEAVIAPPSGDLDLHFEGGAQLQLLQTSCGFEAWRLSVRGSVAMCTGGGGVAHFPAGG